MTKAIRIGRLFGIDIEIDYTWFIIFLIVVVGLASGWLQQYLPKGVHPAVRWLVAIVTTLLFFVSVLLHELSHSVVALRSGLKISGITLFLFGGVSKLSEEPKSPEVELKMAIAGPLMSLALAVIFFGASLVLNSAAGGVLSTMFRWLGIVNGMLAAFNLLPGFPLDGGRVLRAGLWKWSTNLSEATRVASTFGQGAGLLMILGGIFLFFTGGGFGGLWLAFIGWFLMQAAQSSYQQMIVRQALSGLPVRSIMTEEVDAIHPDMVLTDVVNEYIMARNHPAFPVQEGEHVIGLLCLNDVRSIPREDWNRVTAREAAPPLSEHNTISPSADAWDALVRMSSENCGRLVVLEEGRLRGIISRTDIMRLMRHRLELGI